MKGASFYVGLGKEKYSNLLLGIATTLTSTTSGSSTYDAMEERLPRRPVVCCLLGQVLSVGGVVHEGRRVSRSRSPSMCE